MPEPTAQPKKKWKCSVCARAEVPSVGDICPPCKDKIRREAMGEQARDRIDSDRELKKQGVSPSAPPEPRESPKK